SDTPAHQPQLCDRLPNEGNAPWAAWCLFRDLGTKRSVVKAYRLRSRRTEARYSPGTWNQWATKFRWQERARAWDLMLDQQLRTAAIAERIEMGRRQAQAAVAM